MARPYPAVTCHVGVNGGSGPLAVMRNGPRKKVGASIYSSPGPSAASSPTRSRIGRAGSSQAFRFNRCGRSGMAAAQVQLQWPCRGAATGCHPRAIHQRCKPRGYSVSDRLKFASANAITHTPNTTQKTEIKAARSTLIEVSIKSRGRLLTYCAPSRLAPVLLPSALLV